MRILIAGLLLFLAFGLFGQTVRTVGVVYTASAPVHTPSGQGAWIAVDTTSGSWYEWERTTGVWRDAGYRIQLTNTTGVPNYTPSKARGRVALNSGDSLYAYQAGVWNCLNCVAAPDLSGYVEWSDTTTFISTHQDLKDTAAAIRGDFPSPGLTGNGVANYLPQYATASTLDTTGVIWTSTGRLGIGQAAPTARTHITGTGTTSSTTALLVENASGTDMWLQRDDQVVFSYNKRISVENATKSVGIGFESLASEDQTAERNNAGVGYQALKAITTGSGNYAIGSTSQTATTTGNGNCSIGLLSLSTNTTGSNNMAVGRESLRFNLAGGNNAAVGLEALYSNLASSNTAIGSESMRGNTSGASNSAIGRNSLRGNTIGNSNTAIGAGSGRYIADGSTANATSNNSIYIGADTKSSADGQTNQTVIGYSTVGLGSNTTRIGNSSTTQTHLDGSLTLGSTTPAASALLTMTSTTQGLLPPRMTTAQRDAISSPATGLMLFCTDCTATDGSTGVSQTYSSSAWRNHY